MTNILNPEVKEDVLVTRGLPAIAYVDNHDKSVGAAPVIAINRGDMGYYPIFTTASAKELNEMAGVTQAQAEAMHTGSIFGWDVPGADPKVQEALSAKHQAQAV